MIKGSRRPLYQDYQSPELFRTGCALRRGYLTGPVDRREEELRQLLDGIEQPERTALFLRPLAEGERR